jgi:hypothetical protein
MTLHFDPADPRFGPEHDVPDRCYKFTPKPKSVWTFYGAVVQMRYALIAGTPSKPDIIESWLRTKGFTDSADERRAAMIQTLREQGLAVDDTWDMDALVDASKALAAQENTNVFKRPPLPDGRPGPLCLEARCIKAALREATNIRFAGQRWGKTNKSPRGMVAERVFVDPNFISLGVMEPSNTLLFVGHVTGRSGPQSTLSYYESVDRARLTFLIRVEDDFITPDQWGELWEHMQEGGLGALRSQEMGRFDLLQFQKLATEEVLGFRPPADQLRDIEPERALGDGQLVHA